MERIGFLILIELWIEVIPVVRNPPEPGTRAGIKSFLEFSRKPEELLHPHRRGWYGKDDPDPGFLRSTGKAEEALPAPQPDR